MDIYLRHVYSPQAHFLEHSFVNQAIGIISQDSFENVKIKKKEGVLEVHLYSLEEARASNHIVDKIKRGVHHHHLVIIDNGVIKMSPELHQQLGVGASVTVALYYRVPSNPQSKEVVHRTLKIDPTLTSHDFQDILFALSHLAEPETHESKRERANEPLILRETHHKLVPKKKRERHKKHPKVRKRTMSLQQEALLELREHKKQEEERSERSGKAAVESRQARVDYMRDADLVYSNLRKSQRG